MNAMAMRRAAVAAVLGICSAALAAGGDEVSATYREPQAQAVQRWLDGNLAALTATCRHLHANPELSLHEEKTAELVARDLKAAGCEVTTGVGGHGVVGVLRNGAGPVVLVRGDMDALPIVEDTGLDYASKVTVTEPDGRVVGVMHACGHDVHTTMLIGTAQALSALRDLWRGTAVLIAQPAEELGLGAGAMIDDGLFERFPRPQYCLSLHVSHKLPAGTVGYVPGWAAANVDSVDITIFGRGGHGARPNSTVDPIVTAAYVITQLQTLVSRRVDPIAPAVVTVGSIHGGSKHNVIPDEVRLQLTVRSYTDEVRRQLLDGIRQITTDVCKSFGCPRPPDVVVDEATFTPACYNDPGLTVGAAEVFRKLLGDEHVVQLEPEMGGEDFGQFARRLGVPGLQYSLGSISQEAYAASQAPGAAPLPSLHSSRYVADTGPAVRAGVSTMTTLTMSLLHAAD